MLEQDEVEPMTAAVQSPEIQELLDLARFGKRFGVKLTVILGAVVTAFGGVAWYLVTRTNDLDTKLAALTATVEAHRNQHNKQWSGGGEDKGEVPAPEKGPPVQSPDETAPAPQIPIATPAPSVAKFNVPPAKLSNVRVGPPICVNPKTKRKFPCDQVAQDGCYPDGYWHPGLVTEITEKYQGFTVSLCPPK